MAVRLEVSMYVASNEDARRIIDCLMRSKAVTVYKIAESIRKKPSEFDEQLSELEKFGIIERQPYFAQYVLTGYGHTVAALFK